MATVKQKRAVQKVIENRGNVSKAMREAGYTEASAKNPRNLTESDGWQELMGKYLGDEKLAQKHDALLNSHVLDHMTFPPERPADASDDEDLGEDSAELEGQPHGGALLRKHAGRDYAALSDEDIKLMLAQINCTVRKIVHGEQARHVYFWSPDNRARKDALDMAYKLKGRYAATKVQILDPYGDLDDSELEAEIARRHSNGGPAQKPQAPAQG